MHREPRPGADHERALRASSLKWLVVGAVLVIGLSSCETPPPSAYVSEAQPASVGEAVPVGSNEVGEPCNFRPLTNGDIGVGSRRAAALYCGNWQQPSGRIFELGDAAGRQLGTFAASDGWRHYLDSRFACGTPTDTRILDGAPALLMQCTRRTGGWPHLAMVTSVRDHVFAADGIPSALPALEGSVAALAGQPVAGGRAPQLSEAARLMARRSAGQPFGSGDLQRFYDLMAAGDAANNVDNPAQAEQAFREGLAIQQRLLGPDNPGLALTMMKLAAQISHQRNAPEADRLLEQAASLAARSNDPLVMAQLDYYRAVTAAYQHKPREATKWAQAAEAAFTRLLPPGAGARAPADLSLSSSRSSQGIDLALLTADN
jgi:hypothetical protein